MENKTQVDAVAVLRLITDRIGRKQWRSETEKEVSGFARQSGADKATVTRLLAEVRRMYDEAGAGFSGRFQEDVTPEGGAK